MTHPQLDSMLLASTDPGRLHAWYAEVLEPAETSVVDQYRILRFGTFHLLIDSRDDVGTTNREPGRMILNFDVPDAKAIAARMDERGTSWLAPLEDRDGSLFATAIDPDGNYVQIVQLSEKHRAEMAQMGQ
jgi:predicted enzyme related to lactoylglutathione lyase